jgi:hypothetical protein
MNTRATKVFSRSLKIKRAPVGSADPASETADGDDEEPGGAHRLAL